jgi:hypothetical protein
MPKNYQRMIYQKAIVHLILEKPFYNLQRSVLLFNQTLI